MGELRATKEQITDRTQRHAHRNKATLINQREGWVFIGSRKRGKGAGAEQGLVGIQQEGIGNVHIW